jgi:hypothetical protein
MLMRTLRRNSSIICRSCGCSRVTTANVDAITESIHIIFDQRIINAATIDSHFDQFKDQMTTEHYAFLMFRAGRKSYSIQTKYVKLIADALEAENSKTVTDLQIGQLIYGLRMHYETPVVAKYITVVNGLIHKDLQLNSRFISLALTGLRGLSSSSSPVRTLAHTLSTKLLQMDDRFMTVDWCNALYGLQGMRSEHGEAIGLLTGIIARRPIKVHSISGRNIAMCLLSLRGMSSTHPAVRSIIHQMTKFLEDVYPVSLDEIAIGNLFFSMQRFDSRHTEVRNLLAMTARYVTHVTKPFTGLTVSKCW